MLLGAGFCVVGACSSGDDNETTQKEVDKNEVFVTTPSGEVVGVEQSDSVYRFRGIRYALPPLGDRRFALPEVVEADYWQRDDIGIDYQIPEGATCMQLDLEEFDGYRNNIGEDCLVLNVWAPSDFSEDSNLPVMVWIHGGAYLFGSANDQYYVGDAFNERDVILVTVEYRVGAFGFLHTSDPSRAGGGSAGVMDQLAALKWVNSNIQHFGGDPDNVTIFGQSAGGASVETLLSLEEAQPYISRVINQSGPSPILVRTQERALETTQLLLEEAGVGTEEEFFNLSTQEVFDAHLRLVGRSFGPDFLYGPVVDNVALSEFPLQNIANGVGCDKDLILGTTKDEAIQFYAENAVLSSYPPETLMANVMPWVGEAIGGPVAVSALLDEYQADNDGIDRLEASIEAATAMFFRMPTIRTAEAREIGSQSCPDQVGSTYMYRFDWESSIPGYRSLHTLDVPFVFGVNDTEYAKGALVGQEGSPSNLSTAMTDAWTSFARDGVPASTQFTDWPAYDSSNKQTLVFDETINLQQNVDEFEITLFSDVAFDGNSPAPRWGGLPIQE